MFDRRLISNFDWGLFLLTIIIGAVGILTIYSAIYGRSESHLSRLHIKQIYWMIIGLAVLFVVILTDYNSLEKYVYVLYFMMIFFLVYLLVFGKLVAGTQRWVVLGPLTFQPSELMKIVLIMTLAKYFSGRKKTGPLNLKDLIIPFAIVSIPFVLVARQPDLGTAFMFFFVLFAMIFVIGIEFRSFITLMITGILLLPTMWLFLKDYQKKRLITLLDPGADPLGA